MKLTLLTKESKPNISIVVRNGFRPRKEKTAEEELKSLLFELTGVSFESFTDDSEIKTEYIISLGNTSYSKKYNITVDETLGISGYTIKTINNVIMIVGEAPGILFGVYSFMSNAFGYEFFSDDEVSFKKCDEYFSFNEVNIKEKPSFEYPFLSATYYLSMKHPTRYRNVHPWAFADFGWGCHNSFLFLPPSIYREAHPDWYAKDIDGNPLRQLNYNKGDEFIDIVFNKMVELLIDTYKEENYLKEYTCLSFFQEDYHEWDQSEETIRDLIKSGSNAVALIRFINKLADKIKEWVDENQKGRVVYLSTFAYDETIRPPVFYDDNDNVKIENGKPIPYDDSVILRDNVIIRVAPIHANWYVPLNAPENKKVRNELLGWSSLGKANYWVYSNSFHTPYANLYNFNSIKPTYKYLKSLGTNHVYDQISNCGSSSPCFMAYRMYLQSNLMWNLELDVDNLTEKFFTAYYKDAKDIMLNYLNELKDMYESKWREIGLDGECNWVELYDKKIWNKDDLIRWKNYFISAKAIIKKYKDSNLNLYEKLYRRINMESVGIRFLLYYLYKDDFSIEEYKKEANKIYVDLKEYDMRPNCGQSIEDFKKDVLGL